MTANQINSTRGRGIMALRNAEKSRKDKLRDAVADIKHYKGALKEAVERYKKYDKPEDGAANE